MSYLGFDYETFLIDENQPNPKPVCLAYYYLSNGQEKNDLIVGLDNMQEFMLKILNKDGLTLLAHNATFDNLVTYTHFNKEVKEALVRKLQKGEIICTQIQQIFIDNLKYRRVKKYDLATLVKHYFKKDITAGKGEDAWRTRYSELVDTPKEKWPQEAIDYALDDAKWVYRLYTEKQHEHVSIDHQQAVEAAFYLNLAGSDGMNIDTTKVDILEKEINELQNPSYAYLHKKGMITISSIEENQAFVQAKKSMRQANKKNKEYWEFTPEYLQYIKEFKIPYEDLKKKLSSYKIKKNQAKYIEYLNIKLPKEQQIVTAKGNLSVTKDSMNTYMSSVEDEDVKAVIQSFLNIAMYDNIKSSFVKRLKNNKLIRTTYKAVVNSGRTSSSGSKLYPSVNIQQMPREVPNVTYDIRNCFKAKEGYKIVSIDYSGLELISTAYRLHAIGVGSYMLNLLNKGDTPSDLHSILANKLRNTKLKTSITAEEFIKHKKEKGWAEYRQLAKPINLGFPGGIGYDNMRNILAASGIYPKIKVLCTSNNEFLLMKKAKELRGLGKPVRVRQVAFDKYQLIYDELVDIKRQMFQLYPDLQKFLTEGHISYTNGKKIRVKNEFGKLKEEELYNYSVNDFTRKDVKYTQVCNGFLMQTPSAIGAKNAFIECSRNFLFDENIQVKAFIHDEILFEIKDNDKIHENVKKCAEIMINSMQKVIKNVRIAVEAEICGDYWRKAGGEWDRAYWKNANSTELMEK